MCPEFRPGEYEQSLGRDRYRIYLLIIVPLPISGIPIHSAKVGHAGDLQFQFPTK